MDSTTTCSLKIEDLQILFAMDCLLVEEQQHLSSEVGCQGRKTEEAWSAMEVEDPEDHQ